jgi:hypothetical protein
MEGETARRLSLKAMMIVSGGDDRDRTDDLSLAKAALSQLSYIPTWRLYSVFRMVCQRFNELTRLP